MKLPYACKTATFFVCTPFVLSLSLQAQERTFSVDGYVRMAAEKPLVNAVVTFKSVGDTMQVHRSVCDARGYFRYELPRGTYRYTIDYLGESYAPAGNELAIGRDTTLAAMIVPVPARELEEVSVTAQRPFVSYKNGNVCYNLSAHPAAVGSNLLDGIRLLPGLQADDAKGLSLYGFYQLAVAVNGRILRLSNEEVRAYLASLSTADAELVELIRHPGPEYGTGVEAVLNITTKKKRTESLNAFASSELTYRKFLSEAVSLRVNYNKGRWQSYAAYNFSDTRYKETLTTTLGADTTMTKPRRGHGLQMGAEYQIASNHLVGFRGLLSQSQEKLFYNDADRIKMRRGVAALSLYHFLSQKRWTLNNYIDYTGSLVKRSYDAGIDQDPLRDRYHYLHLASDFRYGLTQRLSFLLGVSQNNNWFRNRQQSVGGERTISYREQTSSAYLTLRYRKDRIDTYGGVQFNYDKRRMHASDLAAEIRDHLSSWQPYFSFSYNLHRNHRVNTTFQSYYRRPSFRDLLPYRSYSGFLYRLGNDQLQNSMRYNLSVSYTYLNAASIEINLSHENDPIVEYLTPYRGKYAITKTNLDRSRYFRIVAGTPVPVINRKDGFQWMTTTYFAYHKQEDRGVINGSPLRRDFHAYYLQHKHALTFPGQWYFDAQVTYYSPLFLGVYKTEKQWWLDFTLSKRVKDWKFSLSVYDLLNSNVAKGEIIGISTPVVFEQNWHSPKITLGITWTVGNKKIKSINRKSNYNDERLNSSANEGMVIQTVQ